MIPYSPRRQTHAARRSNWAARSLVLVGALLAFLGFWQGALHSSAARQAPHGLGAGSTNYAPPVRGNGGLLSPTSFPRLPDAGTHTS
jgi:hypothetical protein